MEANITEKAMRGIERFLERRGIVIIEHGWAHGKDKVDNLPNIDEADEPDDDGWDDDYDDYNDEESAR